VDNYDDPFGTQTYKLPAELIGVAQDTGWKLARSLDELSGGYLVQRQVTALTFQDGSRTVQMSAGEIARFLNQLRPMAMDSAAPPRQDLKIGFAGTVGTNILRFIELWLEELRGIICKRAKTLSGTTQTVIVALSSWLATKLGVQPHIATAVATAILVAILTATKGAFCKMTAEQAKAALAAAAVSGKKK
jgi:hypothetical protein